ncbi:MAG: fibrillarin-like rRNA/tRNA 2'-O-methyltransferase [Nitrososphaerota archaeon]|nr:fibrillarin-like rRNA/tRNA 2'-O-methyltransferase [Candidatus Bathyarchaeota archaeon]MDW8048309.1 fibrillarin-like rRNA/tRNA 2'-O-methyltransferase [Nitrososphaerota archaeon]
MSIEVEPHPEFAGIYFTKLDDGVKRITTKNFSPGRTVYGERLVTYNGIEYRIWDPFRSKLAAAILKGIRKMPLGPGQRVLYLGAASGTTASHVSDIVGKDGCVYCVEFSPRSIRDLIDNVCKYRSNMIPILADARSPRSYASIVLGKIDGIYCDIAQPEQARILLDNVRLFLKKGGWALIAVKARSIDVTKEPVEIYEREAKILEEGGLRILEMINLEPYDKAHSMISSYYPLN